MESTPSRLAGRVRAGAAFALAALAIIPLPRLAIWVAERPGAAGLQAVVTALFFLPQLAFPFAITPAAHAYGSIAIPLGLVAATWVALATAFAFAAGRLRPRWLVLAAPAAVVACVIALQLAVAVFGYQVALDGP